MSELVVTPESYNIEPTAAQSMLAGLELHLSQRDLLQAKYNQVVVLEINKENIKKFRELRLAIRDNRTKGIDVWHKTEKDYFLRGGQFIDAIKRKEVAINKAMEDKLEDLEKHFEREEEKRVLALKAEREVEMAEIEFDFSNINLGYLDEETYNSLKAGATATYEARKEEERKIQAQKEAEEAERKLHFLRYNQLVDLRPYMTFEEKEMRYSSMEDKEFEAFKKRLEKAQIEAQKAQEKIRKEKELAEKKLAEEKAKAEAERKKMEAEAEKLRKEKEEAERKLAAQKAEEEAKLKAQQEEEERLKKAPVKEKLFAWIETANLQEFSEENDTAKEILDKFNSFKSWARKLVDKM